VVNDIKVIRVHITKMDARLQKQIHDLNAVKNAYKESYMSNLEFLEEKRDRVNVQLERATSELKTEILTKQRQHYEKQIEELDAAIERAVKEVDDKLANIESKRNELRDQIRQEKESFEFNIERIREGVSRKNVNDIFAMFGHVANALEIIKNDCS
jgi:dsDNA-specific endonuclease/ATPase MutS2